MEKDYRQFANLMRGKQKGETPAKKQKTGILAKIKLLKLDDQQKEELSTNLVENSRPSMSYWVSILLAAVIATFGLLQDSAAVVIGAMLVAPLLRPIELTAFGIATGHSDQVFSGVKTLLVSTLLSILVAYLVTFLSPIQLETAEILARTSPNLLDLFIALASAVVVFLALSFTRFSEAVAGVAMAAALLPPLAVVGIELAIKNTTAAGGALFLYLTNLVAIILIGVLIFFMYGYRPHQLEKQKYTLKNLAILFSLLVIIAMSLYYSLNAIATKINVEQQAKTFVSSILAEEIPEASLENLIIKEINDRNAKLFGSIKLPEDLTFFTEIKQQLIDSLANELRRDVDLELEIIPVASIVSRESQIVQIPRTEQLTKLMREFLGDELAAANIISVRSFELAEAEFNLQILLALPSGSYFPKQAQQDLAAKFKEVKSIPETLSISWGILPQLNELNADRPGTEADQRYQELNAKIDNLFENEIDPAIQIVSQDLSWQVDEQDELIGYELLLDLYAPSNNQELLQQAKERLQTGAENIFAVPTTIKINWFYYDTESLVVN